MARRPNAPKPRQSTRRPAPSPAPRRAPSPPATQEPDARRARSSSSSPRRPGSPGSAGTARTAPSAPSARSALSPPSPAAPPAGRSRAVGRPQPSAELAPAATKPQVSQGEGRVVQAAERFRELVAGRPWRRRRRAIMAGAAVTVLVLAAVCVTAIFLPALQVQQIDVEGTGYVEQEEVRAAASAHASGSVLLLPTGEIAADVAEVPGIDSVEVERSWPDGVRISVTETAPIALLTKTDGATAVIGAEGQELPAAAGEGASLVPLAVAGGSADPEGAAEAMADVLAAMPEPLRGAVQEVTASSASDVTVVLALEDGGTKQVVWGDARDAELKAEVVQALVGQPGTVIDVSSPVAPVTR